MHQLWVQEKVANGDIEVRKVDGKANLVDLLTKHCTTEDIRVHMHHTGQSHVEGRHPLAPNVGQ